MFTFGVSGVSRALTHQLVRHRHMFYEQRSQRYIKVRGQFDFITPPSSRRTFARYSNSSRCARATTRSGRSASSPSRCSDSPNARPRCFSKRGRDVRTGFLQRAERPECPRYVAVRNPALAKKCAELGENGPERSNVEIVADHQAAATAS